MPCLTLGQSHPLHIRTERLTSHPHPLRLLYISDIHLRANRSPTLSDQVLTAARSQQLDLILLGGDLVDHPNQLPPLAHLVQQLTTLAPVLAVAGNHDHRAGLPLVRDTILHAGARWIHRDTLLLRHRARTIGIAGPDAPAPPGGDVRILCAHHPRIWKSARLHGYHLVLAGHLHGCQCVAFHYRNFLFPGALFYPACCLRSQHASAHLVVSRGVSDLFPIRWQCPREVVLCHI